MSLTLAHQARSHHKIFLSFPFEVFSFAAAVFVLKVQLSRRHFSCAFLCVLLLRHVRGGSYLMQRYKLCTKSQRIGT